MRTIILIVFFLFSDLYTFGQKAKLIYVYDPLCGWCYGFSTVIKQFTTEFAHDFDVEVISGGMITGDRIGPIGEVAGYISWAYKDVEKATGVKFGENFLQGTLKTGKAIFTSIPPSVALSVFKTYKPKEALAFATRLQKAIYYDGIEPENLAAYGEIAKEFGINPLDFVSKMKEDKYLETTKQEFSMASVMGVDGFPTVFIEKNGKRMVLTRGYVNYSVLKRSYQESIKD